MSRQSQPSRHHPGAVLTLVCLAQLVLAIDITVVVVANVQIMRGLGFSEVDLTWIVTAYALTFGGLLLFFGRLSDAVGHRRLFVYGMVAFGLASAGAAAATNPVELVLCRAAQGISAAAVAPSALALLGHEFPSGPRRTRAFGFWAASGSAGGVVGYTVGGALVGYLGWRWAFIINLPIAMAAIAAGLRYLPIDQRNETRPRLPIGGALAITAGLSLLIYGLNRGQADGWGDPQAVAVLVASAVSIGLFVGHERRSPEPLIPVRVIVRRESVAMVSAALQSAVVGAAIFLGSLFLQQVLNYSPERLGVATLPLPLGVAIGAFVGTRVVRRIRHGKPMIVTGMLIMSVGLLWIGFELRRLNYPAVLLPGWALLGLGLATSQLPMVSLATSRASGSDRGAVAGLYNMAQQVGAAIGLAAVTTVAVSAGSGSSNLHTRIHGLQVGTLCTAFLALFCALLSAVALPRRPATTEADPRELASEAVAQSIAPTGTLDPEPA